ncbi:MAG: tRNA1(Val) (adenine(37)-N6)-methyltransferase [Proteobacteria bacterium]|nr:tRNA1(Val) (adenine(37)-N6)-methyltransferase [Pseudomonadota bacterium]
MNTMPPPGDLTEDAMFGGRVRVLQPRKGYRFSIDAVALAAFIPAGTGQTLVDLGTGCGVIPLLAAHRIPGLSAVGVEIQEDLAAIARQNVELNAMGDRVCVVRADFTALPAPGVPRRADLVCANPPYRPLGQGNVNPHSQKALARHELAATLSDVAAAAGKLLASRGPLFLVYPAQRLTDLFFTLRQARLEPRRLRLIHTRALDPARLALVEAVKNAAPGLSVDPPLVLYEPGGEYTAETRDILYPVD